MSTFANNDLSSDPVYQERLAAGHVAPPREKSADFHLKPGAKTSVLIFLIGIICIVFYATAISKNIGLIKPVIFGRNDAIVGFMMKLQRLLHSSVKLIQHNLLIQAHLNPVYPHVSAY